MTANPTACPSVGDLERLLAEDLRGAERDTVESHVEACVTCQEQLARLSTPSFRSVAGDPDGTGPDPEPDERFLRLLRESPPRTARAPPGSGTGVSRACPGAPPPGRAPRGAPRRSPAGTRPAPRGAGWAATRSSRNSPRGAGGPCTGPATSSWERSWPSKCCRR